MAIILLNTEFIGTNPTGSAEWGKITGTLSSQTDLQNELDAKINASEKSVANGIASLDANIKVPSSQLDIANGTDVTNGTSNKLLDASKVLDEDLMTSNSDQHTVTQQSLVSYVQNQLAGGVTYRGLIVSPADITGSSTGNAYIDGITNYEKGDMFSISSVGETLITVSDGTVSVDNGSAIVINKDVAKASILVADVDVIRTSAIVSSVFGRTSAVVATSGDYTASQITNVASGGISSTNVQNAINEIDSEKLNTSIVDAKGDILVATADNTITSLPVGTNGQVLQADSTQATGIKYADLPNYLTLYALLYVDNNFNISSATPIDCRNWSILTNTITGLTVTGTNNENINLPSGYLYEVNFYPYVSSMLSSDIINYNFRDGSNVNYTSSVTGSVSRNDGNNSSSSMRLILDNTLSSNTVKVYFSSSNNNIINGESLTTGSRKTCMFIKTL